MDVNLKFVGVKLSREGRETLRSASAEARRLGYASNVEYANKPSELDAVLTDGDEPSDDQYP